MPRASYFPLMNQNISLKNIYLDIKSKNLKCLKIVIAFQVVGNLMKMQCRCHGVSGSCELKTCWRSIPPFSEVGDHLKEKYKRSVQVRNPKGYVSLIYF